MIRTVRPAWNARRGSCFQLLSAAKPRSGVSSLCNTEESRTNVGPVVDLSPTGAIRSRAADTSVAYPNLSSKTEAAISMNLAGLKVGFQKQCGTPLGFRMMTLP